MRCLRFLDSRFYTIVCGRRRSENERERVTSGSGIESRRRRRCSFEFLRRLESWVRVVGLYRVVVGGQQCLQRTERGC